MSRGDSTITVRGVGFHIGPLPAEYARKLTVLSIAPLFGQAMQRMLLGHPIAPLLERWPVEIES